MLTGSKKGFSLIEFIIVIAILSIISGIVGMMLVEGSRSYLFVRTRHSVRLEGELALQRITRSVRMLDKDSITEATSTALTFTNPYNTELVGSLLSITFRLNGTKIERSGDGKVSWDTLADNISSFSITYYKSDNTTFDPSLLSDYENIRWILVEISATIEGETAHLRSQIFPRNLR